MLTFKKGEKIVEVELEKGDGIELKIQMLDTMDEVIIKVDGKEHTYKELVERFGYRFVKYEEIREMD